jgi:predicted alpha/beta hydrolase
MIPTADGVCLAASVYFAQRAEQGVAVFLSATGACRGRYADFALHLAALGWNAVTFDYRSIGESFMATDDVDKASMQAWGERDLDAVIAWAKERFPAQRLVLIGHSIGGQIIPLASNHDQVDAVLMVAAQKGHWRLWPAPQKYAVWGFFRLYIPLCLRLFGHVPLRFAGLCSLAPAVAKDYARWTLHLPYRDADGGDLTSRFANLRAPVLALSFEDDKQYAPRAAVDFLLQRYFLSAPCWRSHIDPKKLGLKPMGHSGFFERSSCPSCLWAEAAEWLDVAANGGAAQFEFRHLPDVTAVKEKRPLEDTERGTTSELQTALDGSD